jgi:N,N-dimethylformamidase
VAKTSIHGYTDRIGVAPGERIRFMVSCEDVETYRADIVRLIHGDTNPAGPGFKEELIDSPVNGEYPGRFQPIRPGSHVIAADSAERLNLGSAFTLHAFIMPTTPAKGAQGILARWSAELNGGYALVIEDGGRLGLWVGDGEGGVVRAKSDAPMRAWVWYSVAASYDPVSRHAILHQEPIINATNSLLGRAYPIGAANLTETAVANIKPRGHAPFIIAGYATTTPSGETIAAGHYNGKIERPRVYARALERSELAALAKGEHVEARDLIAAWDFAEGIGPNGIPSDRVTDTSGNGLHGQCVNMPVRAMTGHNWTGREENFTHAPGQYGAIHFHDDDLEDARWELDFELTIPATMRSDVYAARLRSGEAEEYLPFFVRPPKSVATAKILFLAPTATYAAYANEHMAFDGQVVQAIVGHTPVFSDQDLYLNEHTELGLSTYDVHSDLSGVCYSSLRRPIPNMRPKYRHGLTGSLWGFASDLDLIDWLNVEGYRYDVATDEDLHRDGLELLRNYKVVMTGTHPEYYSGAMLDALEAFIAGGGRIMYMGGNGFYWVTSFHPEKPYLIEVRKAESGSRAWQARPGEYYHATSGERGGLWRNRGRAPQKLVGVGFSAEGFDAGSHFRRMLDSFDPRARFIFEGIEDEIIGNFGLVGGGAAGHELDRYDLQLGTPPNALLLASSEGHSDNYLHVVEEIYFMFPGLGGTQDPAVRADMVYFPTPSGGAVFSTGSISWCGSLSHNGYENNVSRLTGNVLTRFAKDEPLPSE